jgi:hypothetical protein
MTNPGPAGAPAWAPVPPRPSHPLAIASLVTAILGLTLLPMIGGLVAAPLGAAGLSGIRREPDRYGGRGMAVAGLSMGLAFGVVPAIAIFGAFYVVGHRGWAAAPMFLFCAYGLLVIILATRGGKGALVGSSIGVLGGVLALIVGVLVFYGGALLFTHLIADLVRFIVNGTTCAVTHGGGTGKHCTVHNKS